MIEFDHTIDEPFELESGAVLNAVKLRCTIYGELNAECSNAVLVFHALTGSSRIGEWWNGTIGRQKVLDTSKNAFICVNYLGSCYGSTSARQLKEQDEHNITPLVTLRDMVRANGHLFRSLGVKRFKAVIGGSVGGMLALQHASEFPDSVEHAISIAATPLSAMGLALNHIQRQAVTAGDLALARQVAIVSYKSHQQFDARHGRKPNRNGEDPHQHGGRFDIGGYLDHQGEVFLQRFEPGSYELILKAMDLFDLADRDIERIRAKVSLVGISSDQLFPASDVRALCGRLADSGVKASYYEMRSDDGHDAFLSDTYETARVLREVLGGQARSAAAHFLSYRHAKQIAKTLAKVEL